MTSTLRWLLLAGLLTGGAGCNNSLESKEDSVTHPSPSPLSEPVRSPPPPPSSLLLGAPSLSAADESRARAALEAVAREGASDPDSPWALAHGILAFGLDWKTRNGDNALHHIVKTWLRKVPAGDDLEPVGGKTSSALLGFPRTSGTIRVEPHRDLILKNAIERGASGTGPFAGVTGAPSLSRILADARTRFAFLPGKTGKLAFPKPDDVAWSAQAFCQQAARTEPGPAREAALGWTLTDGQKTTLEEVSRALLEMLEEETAFLAVARSQGRPQVEKRKQGVFSHTCGGAHLYQGALACAVAGFPSGEAMARMEEQTRLYLWRAEVELPQVEEGIRRAPQFAPLLINQQVKFLGHLLESVGKAQQGGVFHPTPEEKAKITGARRLLLAQALRLEDAGIYRRLNEIHRHQEQLALDLVGDACHALRGLELTTP